jgi:DNA-binding CsgD family transcriptional regulator
MNPTPSIKKPRKRKLAPEQIEQRENEAYRLRLLGQTPQEIGAVFGLGDRQIRTYLKRAKERVTREIRELDGRAGVRRQFVLLNHLLDESLGAWERSKESKTIKTAQVEKTGGRNAGGDEAAGVSKVTQRSGERQEKQIGDAAFLDRAFKALDSLRALLGLDAPTVRRLFVAEDPALQEVDEDIRTLPADELLRRYRAAVGLGSGME